WRGKRFQCITPFAGMNWEFPFTSFPPRWPGPDRPTSAQPAGPDYFTVQLGAFLGRTLLGFIIHMDDSESFEIAFGPFEIVEQAPLEKSGQPQAFVRCLQGLPGMIADPLHPIQ